jgi:lipopolysaccharide export system ATP-binding protein
MSAAPAGLAPSTLVATGLSKSYGARKVVDGVSLTVRGGEVVGLLGPNGAGKTTTFAMVVGLTASDGGSVRLDGEELAGLPMYLRSRRGLGYLPQEASIFRKLTVRDNLRAVLELDRALGDEERGARADALIAEFGLDRVRDALGETLSGGERRRAEIARSLIASPRFMLFDEPFTGVDPIKVGELQKEIRRLTERGLGILITDHNVRDTLKICDRASIISEGRVLEEGTPAQLAGSPLARRVYLGDEFAL